MAKLLIKSGDRQVQEINLKPGINRFGRNATNDHLVVDPGVSEMHCEVLVEGNFVFVRDLNSTNGTFVDKNPITESALYSGQTLKIGPVEMILDAPVVQLAIPELPRPEAPAPVHSDKLSDGYAACLNHGNRHAVWECTSCTRCFCDHCVRKLRRVGGAYIKLCSACSNPVELTPWAAMMKKKKKSMFGKLVGKIKSSFKTTKRLLSNNNPPPAPPGTQPRA
ncbi:FHA domain-containing protein [Pedosphaera parvula]|uniref:FHA domain containing protein n=1 Tax=Pedosphaera parvula (strain Ellin514) TaxID=320771 RepID=B9XC98_PEDPL|nr:FHA domain-containing protein [Pedosphaera parvula]EEF62566.1 FHA domain containing protein [Pedosphaera parvula Ellin514]